MKTNKIAEITKELENGVKEVFTSEKYLNWLNTLSKFHNYSLNNTILIARQNPNATHVAGFAAWKSKFDRHVKKGEKAIKILAPCPIKKETINEKGETEEITKTFFKAVSVFDIAQTEGKELPNPITELTENVKNFDVILEALKKVSPVKVIFGEPENKNAKGCFNYQTQEITIKSGMNDAQTIKTLIHEIAHAKLHNCIDTENELTRNEKEVQAESVAYTVSKYFNINTENYSFAYVAGWSKNKEIKELKKSMEIIKTTADEIITDIEKQIAA